MEISIKVYSSPRSKRLIPRHVTGPLLSCGWVMDVIIIILVYLFLYILWVAIGYLGVFQYIGYNQHQISGCSYLLFIWSYEWCEYF